jgi:hypothetical protein
VWAGGSGCHGALFAHGGGRPADPRTDDIGGDLDEQWGMHLIGANGAMGDIEDLVATPAEAYTG